MPGVVPRPSRRQFLASTLAFAIPTIIPSRAFGANERVVTGHIGVGGQGLGNLRGFLRNVAAVCDVDKGHLAMASRIVAMTGRKCFATNDYRAILDRKDIDAVVISTPDHWHALPTIQACLAGKDVYCEKPLSLTVSEGRAMVHAAREHGRVVQTGSQQRSAVEFRRACEIVRSGAIGALKTVRVGLPAVNFSGPPVADSAAPAALDYDRWLGQAPDRPYNAKRVHYNFRFFWDYSGGQMTNWGAHHIDIARWALGDLERGPVAIEGTATYHPERWFEVPTACRVTFTYASGVTMVIGQGQNDIAPGVTFECSDGRVSVDRGKLSTTPEGLARTVEPPPSCRLEVSPDHHANFLDCVKTRAVPICDVEIGHRSATACHLANLSLRLARPLRWDLDAERFLDDEPANTYLSRHPRAGYSS